MSADSGPDHRDSPRAFSAATAGAMMASSSPPSMPSSPAWGLSPATARRGLSDAEIARQRRQDDLAGVERSPAWSIGAGHLAPAAYGWSAAPPAICRWPASSPRARAPVRGGEEFGMAGKGEARLVQHRLVDGRGDHGGGFARQAGLDRDLDGLDHGGGIGGVWACRARRWRAPWWRSARALCAAKIVRHRPPASADGCRSGRPSASKAASATSGPMPAGSPMVMRMEGSVPDEGIRLAVIAHLDIGVALQVAQIAPRQGGNLLLEQLVLRPARGSASHRRSGPRSACRSAPISSTPASDMKGVAASPGWVSGQRLLDFAG